MKLWIDDVRPAPSGYRWAKSTNEAITILNHFRLMKNASGGKKFYDIEIIDIDHDAGDFAKDGGDYIRVLDWLEMMGLRYPIRIHSMNPVGVQNMRNIIQKNGWEEVR